MFPLLTCRFVMQIFCFHLLVIYRKLLTEKPMEFGAAGEKKEERIHISMPIADDGLLCDILLARPRVSFSSVFDMCAHVCVRVCVCVFAFESFVCAKSD